MTRDHPRFKHRAAKIFRCHHLPIIFILRKIRSMKPNLILTLTAALSAAALAAAPEFREKFPVEKSDLSATGKSAYFVLEDFYTPLETRYIEVADADLHTRWTRDEAMCHELAQLQEAFTHEWLCHRGDPRDAEERDRYARAELATGEANVRFDKLNRFSKLQADWTHYSHDFEHGVLKCLSRHWPLDYAIVQEPWKAPRASIASTAAA